MPILAVILRKLLSIFASGYPRSIVHIKSQIISEFASRHVVLVWSSLGMTISTSPLTSTIGWTLRRVMRQGFRGRRWFYCRTFRSWLHPFINSASHSFLIILWQESYFVFWMAFSMSWLFWLWFYLDLLLREILGRSCCVWFSRRGHKVRIAIVHHNMLVKSYLVRCKNLTFPKNSLVLGHWSRSGLLKIARPLPDMISIVLRLVYTQLMLVILSFSNSIVGVGPAIYDLLTVHIIIILVILWFYTVSI